MRHLTPTETQAFLHQHPDAVFIDCRSTIEYYFVGHPIGAIHVAWNDGEDWEVNPHFAAEIWRQVDRDPQRPVVIICRSGRRSVAWPLLGAAPQAHARPAATGRLRSRT